MRRHTVSEILGGFGFGLVGVLNGYRRIFSSSNLKRGSLIPIVVAVLVFFIFGILGIAQIAQWNPIVTTSLLSLMGLSHLSWLWWIVAIGLWPVWLILLGAALYLIARLFAAPFYALLAERALVEVGARPAEAFRVWPWLGLTVRMFGTSLWKAGLFGLIGVILFAFSFLPGLNLIATLGFIHMISFDVCDYAFEGMGWSWAQRVQHFQNHWPEFSGFAFGLGLVMVIPGLNLLILPGAVVGGALLVDRTVKIDRGNG